MQVYFFKDSSMCFDTGKNEFTNQTNVEVLRYLKTRFTNIERLKQNFTQIVLKRLDEVPEEESASCDVIKGLMRYFEEDYDKVDKYSYREGFEIEDEDFKSLIFGSIRVPEMIKELGHERIKTEGIPVKHKQFSPSGEFEGYKEYDVIYETHKVDGEKLGLEEDLYAVRCWCTSTNFFKSCRCS